MPKTAVSVFLAVASMMLVPLSASLVSTLYVDKANPSCSNSGPGSATQPFCTIGKAATTALAGQTVIVKAGDYPENVTVANSGTSAAPIVFTAAAGGTVTVSGQTHGFTISSKSWITVQGFKVTQTSDDAIYVTGSSHINLIGNHVSYAGQPVSGQNAKGIVLSGVSDSLVSGNMIDHNTDFGIYLTSGATGVTVSGNSLSYNARGFERAASGIDVFGSNNNVIEFNISHHNEDSGIEFRSGASGNLAVSNVSYLNGDHGIDVSNSPSQRIISNSVYKNVTSGINVEGTSSPATLANNVSVDNGINSPRGVGNIRVDSTAISGATLDYDEVFLHSPSAMIVWGSTSYSSLSAFVAATGKESHGIQADPLWEAADAGDLRLIAGSPAIDSANSGVSDESDIDADGNPRVDDPATPNTGVGPRTYDDRGAYEFQPTAATPTPTATPNPTPTATPRPELPPAAALTVTPSSGVAPLAVTADASGSTDFDATPIANYKFDFGDGSAPVGPQSGATATHTYTAFGTYTLRVTVTDTANLSSTATRQVTVTDGPPAARLTVSPSSGSPPLLVSADASASTDNDGTAISTYTFNFGDGTPALGPQGGATATHTYNAGGNYTVTVTVADSASLSSTATAKVRVKRH